MNTKIFLVLSLFITLILGACQPSPSNRSNDMAFDNVTYIHTFPEILSVQNKVEPNYDIIGIRSFAIYDSLLVLSTVNEKGLWTFLSLTSQMHLGDFLAKGQGPFEFLWPPSVSNHVVFSIENGLYAYIYDSQTGRLMKMDIDKSFETGKTEISIEKDSIPPFLFNFVMLDNSTFLCKEGNNRQTQQLRYILNGDNTRETPTILQSLNGVELREREDINILSTITKANQENRKIVEMPIGLNYLNLYSQDGTFSKTICIGKQINSIEKIQDINRWDRLYTFADLRLFKNFFGVLYINEDEKTYQTERSRLPSILLFDWDGEPLAEIKLDHFITSFDIDFINGELYTLDIHTDEFYKYNVQEIINKF